jgi:hypothetical protein
MYFGPTYLIGALVNGGCGRLTDVVGFGSIGTKLGITMQCRTHVGGLMRFFEFDFC